MTVMIMDQSPAVVCMGCQCWVASMARSLGLLAETGPFDWVAVSPRMVQHMLQTNFHDFQDPRNLDLLGKSGGHANHKMYSPMLETYGFRGVDMFQHAPSDGDFPWSDLEASWPLTVVPSQLCVHYPRHRLSCGEPCEWDAQHLH